MVSWQKVLLFVSKTLKILTLFVVGMALLYVVLIKVDRYFGRRKIAQNPISNVDNEYISISKGDIIFKGASMVFAHSDNPILTCLPGHLAISLTDTVLPLNNLNFDKIVVAESSLFNLKKRRFEPSAKINSSVYNFGKASGRLFLLKNNLSVKEIERLRDFARQKEGLPYFLFAGKEDTTRYNCATFVWQALRYAAGMDVDFDGGRVVFPADILRYYMEGDFEVVRF